MKRRLHLLCATALVFASVAAADEKPKTGFFKSVVMPAELLGEQGAQNVAEMLPPDDEISYQLYVPRNYDPEKPAGLVVFIGTKTYGGTPRKWNDVLIDSNLISVGANDTGNDAPVAERMMKAMLAPQFVARTYKIDPERVYIVGYSDGSKTAMRVAVAQPEVFKGGVYIAGAVFWGDKQPPKLEQVKQNRHAFLIGTLDHQLKETRRVYNAYKAAGLPQVTLITVHNLRHTLPGKSYFGQAIAYLDGGPEP